MLCATMHRAADSRQLVQLLVLLLLGAGIQQTLGGQKANDDLVDAAKGNSVEGVKKAIDAGADLNYRGPGGQTALMGASLMGASDVVELLLKTPGVDVTIPEKDGYTPMHGAGFQGRAEVAKLLIAHGLDPSDRHKDGYTPIHRACWGRGEWHTEAVKVFVEVGGVSVDELGNGKTPLDSAIRTKNQETIDYLRSKGARTSKEIRASENTEL